MKKPVVAVAALCLAATSLSPVAAAAPVMPGSGDWSAYGHDEGGVRFSPLTQITPSNVRDLRVAWVYHMKSSAKADGIHGAIDSSPTGTGLHQSEDQPLVIGQMLTGEAAFR